MPKYFFTAKSQKGEPYSGAREARDEKDLARILRQEGYLLISALAEEARAKKLAFSLPFFNQVSSKEKLFFTRNLRVMIGAGVSLPKALKTLALQAKSSKFKNVLLEITDEIVKGRTFSESLYQYPDIFSEFFCSMVRVGEESGTLEENLGISVRQMEREEELKSKIKGAMLYPAVIILAMVGIGILMLIMVVPQLAKTFEELEVELPLTTRIVVYLGNFLAHKWYLAVLFLVIFIFFWRMALKTRVGKKTIGILILKIPILSAIIKKSNSAYTVRTLASLIAAGIPLVRALEIISDTLTNFYYQRAVKAVIAEVKNGEKLSQAFKPYQDLYSLTVIQMIEVGEETGQTSEVLEKLGDFFEEEVTTATKNFVAVIEPVIMLIVGGAVGFFAISMVQPMYSMLQEIK